MDEPTTDEIAETEELLAEYRADIAGEVDTLWQDLQRLAYTAEDAQELVPDDEQVESGAGLDDLSEALLRIEEMHDVRIHVDDAARRLEGLLEEHDRYEEDLDSMREQEAGR